MNTNCITLGIDHVGLTVSNLEASKEFFVDCLGWKVVGEKPNYPAVFVSDGKSKLTLWQATDTSDYVTFDRHKNVGLHHLALKVADRDTLDELFERVREWPDLDIEFPPEFSGDGPKVHCMIYEPGGNRIEFAWDPR